ncbi:oxepin-CoA hydrolase, alternative type [Primorskyibacter sp. 2E233]|uniref:oxepin-CoA hydrolase, alternative type n=1 Tax=Primorskyibacter sp. 2E233 TaxID=3413431 RepID=UPI003BF42011
MTLAHVEDLGDRLVVVNANNARRNALSDEYYEALGDALRLAEQPRITSVTLWGDGFFCSGGDLNVLATRRDLPQDQRIARIEALHDLIRGIKSCPKPVIAAVEGGAAGAGASIAFACDFIVAARGAGFTAAYVKAGLVPDGGLSASLSSLVPRALVSQMLLLGETVSAERLAELGGINAIAEPSDVRATAMTLADRIAKGPMQAQGRIKALIASAQDAGFTTQLDHERNAMAEAVIAPEAEEGINAFLNKRRPDFTKLRTS